MHYGQNNGGLNQRVNNPMFRPLPTFNNGLRPAFLSSMNPNVKYVFLKKGEVAPQGSTVIKLLPPGQRAPAGA